MSIINLLAEGKAYLGWERIKDMLRNEEHKRLSTDLPASADSAQEVTNTEATALSKLKSEEFLHLVIWHFIFPLVLSCANKLVRFA